MTDGFFSRPSLARTAFMRIAPDRVAIEAGLKSLGVTRLAAVVPVHSHHDHAMDSPLVAMQTGALLVGSESTLNIGRGLGMPEGRMRRVQPRDKLILGRWSLTFLASRHVPLPVLREGVVQTIDAPLVPPAHATAWREGQTWALLVEHPAPAAPMLVLGSAGFVVGAPRRPARRHRVPRRGQRRQAVARVPQPVVGRKREARRREAGHCDPLGRFRRTARQADGRVPVPDRRPGRDDATPHRMGLRATASRFGCRRLLTPFAP